MARDLRSLSIDMLAKHGHFEEFCRRASTASNLNLARVFDRAVTDFRALKRRPGHQQILQWCIDRGLDFRFRAGWLNESIVELAARYGNSEIVAIMVQKGIPEEPFCRAALGDIEFLSDYVRHHSLAELRDENGFNLLFSCAGSGLGRRDERAKRRLANLCRFLLDHGVSPSHEVAFGLPIFPAFLCASFGGNEEVMGLLLDHGGLRSDRMHQTLEHSLEPHQRSGDPYYLIAELILERGFDLNDKSHQGRTLLHGAANRGTILAVQWLLENGADANALDDFGRTPLHVCAARNRSTIVVKRLIDAGSERNAKDLSGKTAIDYAREKKRVKVVAYLESIGAS